MAKREWREQERQSDFAFHLARNATPLNRSETMAHEGIEMALVYCPCPDLEEAKRLGNALLDARLAGCINILPGMVSLYDWKGAREQSNEAVLIVKTAVSRTSRVKEFLEKEHPYEVPAILTLPLSDVNFAYRGWLLEGIG
jgi:periplasmic divalent cation tolerance protein